MKVGYYEAMRAEAPRRRLLPRAAAIGAAAALLVGVLPAYAQDDASPAPARRSCRSPAWAWAARLTPTTRRSAR